MKLKVVRALFDAHTAHEERAQKLLIASMRVAEHADEKGYAKFMKEVFGRDD